MAYGAENGLADWGSPSRARVTVLKLSFLNLSVGAENRKGKCLKMESKGKRIALNMISQVAAFVLSMAINFFLIPVIIEKIGKDIYGFYSLAGNFLEYATVVTAVINGMANRYITVAYSLGEKQRANRYFTSVTLVNVFLTVVLAVPATILIIFLEKVINIPPQHVFDVKCLWTFTFLMFFVNLIFSRYEVAPFATNRLEITAFINMTSIVIKAALLTVVYSLFYPYIGYVGVIVFVCALYSAAVKVHFKNKLTPDLKFRKELFDFGTVKELAAVGIWNSVSQMSQMLFTGLDLLIANLFIGAEQMSILSVAKTLPVMLISFIGVIAGTFYPTMTISYSTQSRTDFLKETGFAARMCGFICSIPIAGIVVFGREFFTLWLPTLTAEEINTVQILSVLTLMPQLLSIYVFPLHQINTITCNVRVPALLDCFIGVLNIIIVYLLLEHTSLGLYAIAGVSSTLLLLKTLIFVPLYAAHNIGAARRTFYPYIIRGILVNAVELCIFTAVKHIIPAGSWLMLLCSAAVAAVLGGGAGFFVIFDGWERKKAVAAVRNKLSRGKAGE